MTMIIRLMEPSLFGFAGSGTATAREAAGASD
jgi:hypothetical protein